MTSTDINQLRDTVRRLEERLQADESALVGELMAAYVDLKTRFAKDLQDERDVLLSCGGALMLVQQVERRHHG